MRSSLGHVLFGNPQMPHSPTLLWSKLYQINRTSTTHHQAQLCVHFIKSTRSTIKTNSGSLQKGINFVNVLNRICLALTDLCCLYFVDSKMRFFRQLLFPCCLFSLVQELLPGFVFRKGKRIDKRERLLYYKLHDRSKRMHLTQSTSIETEFIQIFKQLL